MKRTRTAATTTKPIQKWTTRELQARLLPVVTQADPDDLRRLLPLLDRFEKALDEEKVARQKDLDSFRVTGDADTDVLGVLAELFSRPLRAALSAVSDRLFVVRHAKKVIERRLARE